MGRRVGRQVGGSRGVGVLRPFGVLRPLGLPTLLTTHDYDGNGDGDYVSN